MTIARLVVIALLLSAPAHAQSVEAETLFREGKRLLKAGKIAQACEKLEASDRIESSVGTLLNLADCREKNHQLATAWATFDKAASAAKVARDGKREAEARKRAKKLEPRLLYLTVAVTKVDGLAITRNGTPVDPALWNQSVPIDRGEYTFVAEAPGYVAWKKTISLEGEAQKATVDVPALAKAPVETTPPRIKTAAPEDVKVDNRAPVPDRTVLESSPWTGTRKAAVVLGVVGLAAAGGATYFGLHGRTLERQADALCPTTTCNDDHALQLNTDARHAALYADLGYAGAGALVATAVVLWIVGAPVAPVVTSEQAGIAFGGRF